MKYPFRSGFRSFEEYQKAFSVWESLNQAVISRMMGMFDVLPESREKPDWLEGGGQIYHVAFSEKPEALRWDSMWEVLASVSIQADSKVKRLCHGIFDGQWAVYIECEPISEESIAA